MRVCTLASGSSGNATYVEGDGSAVLVDAGLSGKAVIELLESRGIDPLGLDGILVTHEHIDHIRGIGVLSRKFDLKVYATEQTWGAVTPLIGEIRDYNRCILEPGRELEKGELKIEHFETSHDAVDSIGFCFHNEGIKIGITTDTGFLTSSARKEIDGADLMIFEANHDLHMLKNGRYPWNLKKRILSDRGHLSNIAAGHCLASLVGGKTSGIVLAHLSKENNIPELAYSTVAKVLEESGLNPERDIVLEVAPRSEPGTLWEF
ncbi:MAG: MBL fold metallo-hydrolase [Firmicutes bacterium HGW-Firmicutes-14]|nr:MAG: MBL fold metallo-hydrolase [Firmicutes bacterium HGW-Firmicutes-14]